MTTTTTPSGLTDRYVWAATRSLPERQREDVERELRGSIADAIDSRVEAGADPAAAELAVLAGLGDPARLAAQYADRPRHLIGPVLFFDYLRLLKLLLAIVLPVSVAGVLLAQLLAGAGFGEIMGTVWVTALSVTVHLGFWTTLAFAIVEWTGAARSLATEWTPDTLPELPSRGSVRLADVIASAVFLAIMVGAVIWQHFFSVFQDAQGQAIPVIEPGLWSFWLPFLFVVVVLELIFTVVVYRVRRWTVPLAIVNIVLAAAAAAPIAWLFATDRLLNPAFIERLGLAELVAPGGILAIIGVFVTVGVALWDTIDGIVKTVRARRGPAVPA